MNNQDNNSSMARTLKVCTDALWHNNPALVQLLGLCPLLGVSNSVVNALGLGIATIAVLTLSSFSVSLLRAQIPDTVRLPAFVMIIATFTTCIELLMQAYTYSLYTVLGIFIPIIVTNCAILGRAEAFARRNPVGLATIDGFVTGIGFGIVLVLLGAARELFGTGAIFQDMDLLLGPIAKNWDIVVFESYRPMLVAILPPGAFIFLGFFIALHTWINDRIIAYQQALRPKIISGAKRIRIS